MKVTPDGHTLRIEYAGLARGEDPTIGTALDQFVQRHGAGLEPLLREQTTPAPPWPGAPGSADSPRVD